jgi:hypothetical protein
VPRKLARARSRRNSKVSDTPGPYRTVTGVFRLDNENVVAPVAASWWTPISLANGHSRVWAPPWKTTREEVTVTVPVSMTVGAGSPWTKCPLEAPTR